MSTEQSSCSSLSSASAAAPSVTAVIKPETITAQIIFERMSAVVAHAYTKLAHKFAKELSLSDDEMIELDECLKEWIDENKDHTIDQIQRNLDTCPKLAQLFTQERVHSYSSILESKLSTLVNLHQTFELLKETGHAMALVVTPTSPGSPVYPLSPITREATASSDDYPNYDRAESVVWDSIECVVEFYSNKVNK